jgi:hypothetical protein
MAAPSEYPFEYHGRIAPDCLELDEFEAVTPTGHRIKPHVGERIWFKPYGVTFKDSIAYVGAIYDQFGQALRADDLDAMDKAGRTMAEVICSRCLGWDVTDPSTGRPVCQPTAGPDQVYEEMPGALFMHLVQLLAGMEGIEATGKGGGGSPPTTSPKKARPPRRSS